MHKLKQINMLKLSKILLIIFSCATIISVLSIYYTIRGFFSRISLNAQLKAWVSYALHGIQKQLLNAKSII